MILPFIYDFSPSHQLDQLWVFFASLTMQKSSGGPIVAPSPFFDPAMWKNRPEATSKEWSDYYCYDLPQSEDLEHIYKIVFPDQVMQRAEQFYGSKSGAAVSLHKETFTPMIEWLVQTLLSLQQNKQRIDAVMVLGELPSINEACKQCNVAVLHFEWGPLRPPTYLRTAYLDRFGVIAPSEIRVQYDEFKKYSQSLPILNRRALLSLFLQEEYCQCIQFLESKPEFEIGLCAQEDNNYRILSFGYANNADLIAAAREHYSDSEILFRDRPTAPLPTIAHGLAKDISLTPAQFICRCKRVAALHSNMIFEAMLWGKTAYALDKIPYEIQAITNIAEKNLHVVDEEFLCFVLFVFLIPYQRLLEPDYLSWRLSNPKTEEIYQSNLKYYCEQQHLNYQQLQASGFSAKEILRQKERCSIENRHFFPSKNDAPLDPNRMIRKIQLRTKSNQILTKLFCIDTQGSFRVSFPLQEPGETQITFFLTAGSKIDITASLDKTDVKIHPTNAEEDGTSFCRENPTFFLCAGDAGVLTLSGTLEEKDFLHFLVNRLFEEKDSRWQLGHKLQEQYQENDKLKQMCHTQEQTLQKKTNWENKLQTDIEQLNGEIQAKSQWADRLQLDIEQLNKEILAKDLWMDKLQTDIEELNYTIRILQQKYVDEQQKRLYLETEWKRLKAFVRDHPLRASAKAILKRNLISETPKK